MPKFEKVSEQEFLVARKRIEDRCTKLRERLMKPLLQRRKLTQASCPHDSLGFVPDPAGGHDSYHYCHYCGKEV